MDINTLLRLNLALDGALRSLQARDNSETKDFVRDSYDALVSAMEEFLDVASAVLPEEIAPSVDADLTAVAEEPAVIQDPVVAEASPAAYDPVIADSHPEDDLPDLLIPNDDEPLRVADKISAMAAVKDLRHSFSLNDKFRFIRSIFGGDADKFDVAVGHIESLDSLRQAYDFMLKDLNLDVEREDDCDFMTIVSNHFNTI